jgi:hypothetical protein
VAIILLGPLIGGFLVLIILPPRMWWRQLHSIVLVVVYPAITFLIVVMVGGTRPQFYGGFVEMFYNHVDYVLQEKLQTFVNTGSLEPHAAYIKLNHLALD